jgi:hypothetical protein
MPVTIDATAPPRKATVAKAADSGSGPAMSRKAKERAEGLAGIGQLVYAGLLFARQPADAGAINKFFPPVTVEVAKLADSNDKIAEVLDKLNEIGPYAGLITAVTPLIMQLLVNHDRVPATAVASLGVVSKTTLEAEVEAEIMRAEMHAMKMQMEVQQQREEMRKEYEAFADSIKDNVEDSVGAGK